MAKESLPPKNLPTEKSNDAQQILTDGNKLLKDVKSKIKELKGYWITSEEKGAEVIQKALDASNIFLPEIKKALISINSNIKKYGESEEITKLKENMNEIVISLENYAIEARNKLKGREDSSILGPYVKKVDTLVADLKVLRGEFTTNLG